MNKCIDCGIELTVKNKSKHQPDIRCLVCFKIFADKTTATLEDMLAQFSIKK